MSTEPNSDETPTPQLRLYLIRHGETAWSLTGQHTGHTDLPLTAHGEEEARKLTPWLKTVQFSHVLTSPLRRAQRTCALAGLESAAEIEPDLAEWDYGDYEGKLSMAVLVARCLTRSRFVLIGSSHVFTRWTGMWHFSRTASSVARWPRDGSDCRWSKDSTSSLAQGHSAFSASIRLIRGFR